MLPPNVSMAGPSGVSATKECAGSLPFLPLGGARSVRAKRANPSRSVVARANSKLLSLSARTTMPARGSPSAIPATRTNVVSGVRFSVMTLSEKHTSERWPTVPLPSQRGPSTSSRYAPLGTPLPPGGDQRMSRNVSASPSLAGNVPCPRVSSPKASTSSSVGCGR